MHAQVMTDENVYLDLWLQIIRQKISNQARALSIMGMEGAVVRSTIARSLVSAGFHPTFGIHHDSQLNAFNLADDLIEPYRAIVDIVSHENTGSNVQLSKNERKSIAHVIHNACIIDKAKINVMSAIDIMVESLKRIILDKSYEELKLPLVLPIESGGNNRMRLIVILSPIDKGGTKTEYTKLRKFLQKDRVLCS